MRANFDCRHLASQIPQGDRATCSPVKLVSELSRSPHNITYRPPSRAVFCSDSPPGSFVARSEAERRFNPTNVGVQIETSLTLLHTRERADKGFGQSWRGKDVDEAPVVGSPAQFSFDVEAREFSGTWRAQRYLTRSAQGGRISFASREVIVRDPCAVGCDVFGAAVNRNPTRRLWPQSGALESVSTATRCCSCSRRPLTSKARRKQFADPVAQRHARFHAQRRAQRLFLRTRGVSSDRPTRP
jgi:hypothetical protein